MEATFTVKFKKSVRTFIAILALSSISLLTYAQVQTTNAIPFKGSYTYWVDGIGSDVAGIKDTFKDFSGAYTPSASAPFAPNTPFAQATGILSALTGMGTDSTTTGQINIIIAAGYLNYVEPNLITVGNAATGGYPYQAGNRNIVISPVAGTNFTITTNASVAGFTSLFRFYGIQFFTINGSGTFGQNNLTFLMSASNTATTNSVISMIPMSSSGNQSITIQNCNIIGNSSTASVNTLVGIYSGGTSNSPGLSNPGVNVRNQNISILNNVIKAVQYGILMNGVAPVLYFQDQGLVIRGNTIGGQIAPGGATNTDYIGGNGAAGICLIAQANVTIDNNVIRNSVPATSSGFRGIALTTNTSNVNNCLDSNIYITRNKVYNLNYASPGAAIYGFRMNLGTHTAVPLSITLANNTFANIRAGGVASITGLLYAIGISVEDNSGNVGLNLVHNTVNMYGSALGNSAMSACVAFGPTLLSGVVMVNNIFSNRMGRARDGSNVTGAFNYGVVVANPTANPFLACDGNDYYVTTSDGGLSFVGYANGRNQTSINLWRNYTVHDTNSVTIIPPFVSDTLCELTNSTPSALSYMGISGTNLATDINGNSRPSITPSIGAFQFSSNSTDVNGPLVGGTVYSINGVKAWPIASNATSGSFANLSEAINYLNNYGVTGTGTVTIQLASSYPGEGNNYLPAFIDYPGTWYTTPVVFQPAGGVIDTITVPNQAGFYNLSVLRFIGSKYITFNGNLSGLYNQTTIMLPPLAASASNLTTKVVSISSNDYAGASNIQINGCVLTGCSDANNIYTFAGIYMGHYYPNFPSGGPAYTNAYANPVMGQNNNMTFSKNVIQAARNGFFLRGFGTVAGLQDNNNAIQSNVIGGQIAPGGSQPTTYIGGGTIGAYGCGAGIFLKSNTNAIIDNNVIKNVYLPAGQYDYRGIDLHDGGDSYGKDSVIVVSNNRIFNFVSSSYGSVGIRVGLSLIASDSLRQITIMNNYIGKILGTGIGTGVNIYNPTGIMIDNSAVITSIGVSIYNNTVNLTGNTLTGASGSTCLYIGANIQTYGLTVLGNIFSNKMTSTNIPSYPSYSTPLTPAIGIAMAGSVNPFKMLNYNVYSVFAANANNYVAVSSSALYYPSLGKNFTTTGTWRTFSQRDSNSYMHNVLFVSDTLPDVVVATAGPVVYGGKVSSAVVKDIYGAARYGYFGYNIVPAGKNPCIGAVEFAQTFSPLVGGSTYLINGVQNPPTLGSSTGSFATINKAFHYLIANGVDTNLAPASPIKLLITTGYAGEGDTLIMPLTEYRRQNANRIVTLTTDAARTIYPASINYPITNNGSVIRFSGGSYFTIDGSMNGTTSRDLTITLPPVTNSTNPNLKVVDFIANTATSVGVTVKNCNIIGNSTPNTNNTFAGIYSGSIYAAGSSTLLMPSNAWYNGTNNNSFINNYIGAVKNGIYLRGYSGAKLMHDSANYMYGNMIGGNTINGGAANTDYFGDPAAASSAGIFLSAQRYAIVDSNLIHHCISNIQQPIGIQLSNISGTLSTDADIIIRKNNISNLKTSAASVYGIYMNLGNDSIKNINIYNNWISGLSSSGSSNSSFPSTSNPIGILIDGTVNPAAPINNIGVGIYHNSINFGTSTPAMVTAYSASAGVFFNTAIKGGVSMINNIIQNLTPATSSGSLIKNYGVVVGANQNIFTGINSNNYYANSPNTTNVLMAYNAGSSPVNLTSMAAIQSFTYQDTGSINFWISNFINDTILDLAYGSSSVLVNKGSYIATPAISDDILHRGRNVFRPYIGASEFTNGNYVDSIAPRLYNYTPLQCGNGPFAIDIRAYYAGTVASDTLYYSVNGGAVTAVLHASLTQVGSQYKLLYNLPAQASGSFIWYRVSVNATSGVNGKEPAGGGWDTISTNVSNYPYGWGFDGPNNNHWVSQSISGVAAWNLGTYGTFTNPNFASAYSGVKMGMFPAASLPNGSAARLISPCFDLSGPTLSLPTFRFWITQNADLPNNQDYVQVTANTGYGGWIPLNTKIVRPNPKMVFPGWVQVDVCLADFLGSPGLRLSLEGYSAAGNNIFIDSLMLIDNYVSSAITPLSNTICGKDSVTLTIANSSPGVSYTMFLFDPKSYQNYPLSNSLMGTGSSLIIKGRNPMVDTALVHIYAQNTLTSSSSCVNWLRDTATVYIKLFKNGPFISKGIPFSGNYNYTNIGGPADTADGSKVGDTLTYNIVPPTGLTQADYGTRWTIGTSPSPQAKTITNRAMANLLYTAPTTSTAGKVVLYPSNADADSIFYLKVNFKLLPSGCDSTVIRKLTVTSVPLTAFTNGGRDTGCSRAPIIFSDNTPIAALTYPYTYAWDFGDSTFSSNTLVQKTYANSGTYTVKLTVTNKYGLAKTTTKTFTVLPAPTAGFVNSRPCKGDSVVFSNTTSGGLTYKWNYSYVGGGPNYVSLSAEPHVYLTAPTGDTATFNFQMVAYNSYGCTDTARKVIQLFAKPHAQFTITNHCLGSMATITNYSSIFGTNNSFGSVWYPGNGDTILANNPVYYYKNNGTYTIKLVVSSNYGCMDSAQQTVVIYDKPRSGFTIDTTTACMGTTLVINDTAKYQGVVGNNKMLYLWDFGDQSANSTVFSPVHAYGALGNYRLKLIVTDTVNYCIDSSVQNVYIGTTPIAQFQMPYSGCSSGIINFINKTAGLASDSVKYSWKFGDGGSSTLANPTHIYTFAGFDTVALTATAKSGCASKQVQVLPVATKPSVSIQYIALDHYDLKIFTAATNFRTYKWTIYDGQSVSTYTNYRDNIPMVPFFTGGFHPVSLLVTDTNGCSGYDSTMVKTDWYIGLNETSGQQYGLNIYPNPFTESTNISYTLEQSSNVKIVVFDLLGRVVSEIDNGTQSSGIHTTILDAEKLNGSSALYLVHIQIGDTVISRHILKEK